MSAAHAHDDHADQHADARVAPHPMQRTPAQVRAELISEDVPRFDEAWRKALAAAAEQLDLAPVEDMLEQWRMVAAAANGDPEGYRRMIERAGEIQAAYADGEPPESVHARFGLRDAREVLADVAAKRGVQLP